MNSHFIPFLNHSNGCIDFNNIPINIILKETILHNHLIINNFVYGIKYVDQYNQDMWQSTTYEEGKTYYYYEPPNIHSSQSFEQFIGTNGIVHSSGLWAYHIDEFFSNNNSIFKKKIIVRFPIQHIIPFHNQIKSKSMQVVKINNISSSDIINLKKQQTPYTNEHTMMILS